jgi:TolB-like protein/Tfp pilus assembly protein PilF
LRFLAELKRRNVIRMAGLYLVGAWLAVQVAATLLPVFDAPAWLMKVLVAVLAFGFFAALVFSWIYELTPAGLQRDHEISSGHAPYQGTERRLRRISDAPTAQPGEPQRVYSRERLQDRLIIFLLLLAVGYFLLDKFVLDQSSPSVQGNAAVPIAVDPPASRAPPASASDLIAVLPFRNRSALPEDAYFAEGMHDDLLTQLAKVAGLKVISRTSMMRYADTTLSVPEIARELGAAVILEGAVQRSGDQVLVTVQLIDADSDVHLWAERYDRALTTDTVFAIQAEIAQAVADATRVVLSPAEAKALATGSTDNLLAYEAFLQGKLLAANDLATPERFAAALVQFERAVALDPKFVQAHARKARIQLASYWFGYADASMREAAKRTTAQAVALAPDDIETWMAQAYFHYWGELDYASADALLNRVIERAPGHAEAWYARGLVGRRDGRFDDTIAAFRESLKIDPANTDTLLELSNTLLTLGEYEESDALRERAKALGADVPSHAAETALSRGDIEGAWAAIEGPNDFYSTLPFRIALASRNPDWIARALSTELWPERLRQFPNHPDTHALAEAEALLVLGQHDAAQARLRTIKERIDARDTPYPGGWSSTSYYFYYPSDLPGMLGDLEGVRAAERDWIATAPRDVWAESGIRLALAVAYARAGDAERALDHLEKTQSQVGPVSFISIAHNPGLDSLRQHPRYLALAAEYEQWKQQRQASPPL